MGIDPNLLCYHRPSLPLNNMSSTIRQRRKTHFLCLIFKRVPFRCNVQRTRRKHLWPVSCCGWSEEWFGPTSLISHLSLDIIYKKRVTDLKCECRHTILHFFFLCPLSSFYPPLTCSSECAPSLTISLSLSLSCMCCLEPLHYPFLEGHGRGSVAELKSHMTDYIESHGIWWYFISFNY